MSVYFSKVIKTGDRNREFNFRQVSAGADERYSVDVPDDKGNRVTFSMYKNAQGGWKTASQSLPLWIHNAETELGNAIDENKTDDAESKKNSKILNF
jgi:hypothetical protein